MHLDNAQTEYVITEENPNGEFRQLIFTGSYKTITAKVKLINKEADLLYILLARFFGGITINIRPPKKNITFIYF